MSYTSSNPASRKSAKSSRRAEVRLCRVARELRENWTRPLRHTRRAINASVRLIDVSSRVIEASERLAAGSPVRASRQYHRVSGWLITAAGQLGRAARCLQDTNDGVALVPELASDAPMQLIDAAMQLVAAMNQLAGVSEHLQDTSARLLDAVKGGVIIPDLAAEYPRSSWAAKGPRLIAAPPCLLCSRRRKRDHQSIPSRRQRPAPATIDEAVRRVSRGRAPPPVSTCSF